MVELKPIPSSVTINYYLRVSKIQVLFYLQHTLLRSKPAAYLHFAYFLCQFLRLALHALILNPFPILNVSKFLTRFLVIDDFICQVIDSKFESTEISCCFNNTIHHHYFSFQMRKYYYISWIVCYATSTLKAQSWPMVIFNSTFRRFPFLVSNTTK